MSARGVTRKRRRPFDAGDFILGHRRTSLPVVPRSLRLLHWIVHCVGYGLHHPDTTGERHPATPTRRVGRRRGITAIRRSGTISTLTGDSSSQPCRPDPFRQARREPVDAEADGPACALPGRRRHPPERQLFHQRLHQLSSVTPPRPRERGSQPIDAHQVPDRDHDRPVGKKDPRLQHEPLVQAELSNV